MKYTFEQKHCAYQHYFLSCFTAMLAGITVMAPIVCPHSSMLEFMVLVLTGLTTILAGILFGQYSLRQVVPISQIEASYCFSAEDIDRIITVNKLQETIDLSDDDAEMARRKLYYGNSPWLLPRFASKASLHYVPTGVLFSWANNEYDGMCPKAKCRVIAELSKRTP